MQRLARHKVELNGVESGESGINGLVALACRAPVTLITGDQQTVTEGNPFFKDTERVVVKQSITRFAASALHPLDARDKITGAARGVDPGARHHAADAARRVHADRRHGQVASWVKGVERTGTRTVRVEGEDPLAVSGRPWG